MGALFALWIAAFIIAEALAGPLTRIVAAAAFILGLPLLSPPLELRLEEGHARSGRQPRSLRGGSRDCR